MSPELIAGLTAFVGLCLVTGWFVGFRNRGYVGWLGVAFIALAGFLLSVARNRQAQELGAVDPRLAILTKVLLFVWLAALVASLGAAIGETRRRLKELKESHQAAAEGFLEAMRAAREGKGNSGMQAGEGEGRARDDGEES